MADDLNEKIELEGAQQFIDQLRTIGEVGQEAFGSIARAAADANASMSSVSNQVASSFSKIKSASKGIDTSDRIKDVEAAAFDLGSSLKGIGTGIASFAARIGTAGAVAAAVAGGGLLALAKRVASVADNTEIAREEQEALQHSQLRAAVQFEASAISQDDAQRKLNRDFSFGRITIDQYTQGLQKIKEDADDNARSLNRLQAAQENYRRELAKQNALHAQQEQERQLIKAFGAEGTAALLNLGRALERIQKAFTNAFGPVLASAANGIATALQTNQGAIQDFFSNIAKAISPTVDAIGKQLPAVAGQAVKFLSDVASVITTVLIPALTGIITVLDGIAGAVNFAFGTNFTGQQLLITAGLIKMAGAFQILTSAITGVVAVARILLLAFGIWPAIIVAVAVAIGLLIARLIQTGTIQAAWTALVTFLQEAWQSLLDGLDATSAAITEAFTSLISGLTGLWTSFVGFLSTIWAGVVSGAQTTVNFLVGLWTSFRDTIVSLFIEIRDFVNSVWASIQTKIDALFGSGVPAQERAGGGPIFGPGGPTDDRVPIWASPGEFMMKAKAVKHYGLGLMYALNNLRFNPNAFAFAMGGLIDTPTPKFAFADGGFVSKPNNVLNLTIDGQTFHDLRASDDTMDKLSRFAIKQQVRSPGRKPTWHR